MEKTQIWVFMEQRSGVLHDVGLELLGKARELAEPSGSTVTAVRLGWNVIRPSVPLGKLSSRGSLWNRTSCTSSGT